MHVCGRACVCAVHFLTSGPGLYEEAVRIKPVSSIPLWSLLQFLIPVSALTSLGAMTWNMQAK